MKSNFLHCSFFLDISYVSEQTTDVYLTLNGMEWGWVSQVVSFTFTTYDNSWKVKQEAEL